MAGGVVAPKMSGAAIVVAPHHKRRRQTRSRLLASVPRAIGATAEAAITLTNATIYDVAAHAGVSIKSVSRVLNGEPNVSATLREKVEAAVAALGYRRNLAARGLAGASSLVIAALVDAGLTIEHWRGGRGSDYLSRLHVGALMEARAVEHHLMIELVDHGSPRLRAELSSLLASIRPAGVILTPPNSDHQLALEVLDDAGIPYARISPGRDMDRGICVSMDERGAAAEMTRHLIALGHRTIGFITGPIAYGASQRRLEGFLDAMHGAGLDAPARAVVAGDFTFDGGAAAMARLLNDVPGATAVFASNDDMALGALKVAGERGLRVPEDMSIGGFDDSTSAMYSSPQLTTIRQPVAELAAAATRRLIPALIRKLTDGEHPRHAIVAHELIVRQSTAAPRAG